MSASASNTKLAFAIRRGFDCATWLHRAKELPKEGFKGEVERHLTGKETEAWEIIYFKLYKSQIPVVELWNCRGYRAGMDSEDMNEKPNYYRVFASGVPNGSPAKPKQNDSNGKF